VATAAPGAVALLSSFAAVSKGLAWVAHLLGHAARLWGHAQPAALPEHGTPGLRLLCVCRL